MITSKGLRLLAVVLMALQKGVSSSTWRPRPFLSISRGGSSETGAVNLEKELPLDEKVRAAMERLGLKTPQSSSSSSSPSIELSNENSEKETSSPDTISKEKIDEEAKKLSEEFNIPISVSYAALYASGYSLSKARDIIEYEKKSLELIKDGCNEVEVLVEEGYDRFMVRRSLALCEMDVENARAILIAEKSDEEAETEKAKAAQAQAEVDKAKAAQAQAEVDKAKAARAEAEAEANKAKVSPKEAISVPSNFDPSSLGQQAAPAKPKKVIFSINSSEIQSIILESPVPVLLDVYAPWCGPCKALTPALESLVSKSNGMFRLVKLNSDEERAVVSESCLDVRSLPTLMGIKDGKIINVNVGPPQSEEAFKAFLTDMMMGSATNIADEEKLKLEQMTQKLVGLAGSACIPFSKREQLQTIAKKYLKALDESVNDDISLATVKIIDAFMNNILRQPRDQKYRFIKYSNRIIQEKVKPHANAIGILKVAGWREEPGGLAFHLGELVVNTAPIKIVGGCLKDWIETKKKRILKEQRRRKDQEDRLELRLDNITKPDLREEKKVDNDPNVCHINIRVQGKKKVESLQFHPDEDTLKDLQTLISKEEQEMKFICASKKITVDSADVDQMSKSFRELGFYPSSSIVVKMSTMQGEEKIKAGGHFKERMKAKNDKKKGTHTMQSVGIYSKDDNNKAELIDGGGGTWYEHDVSDTDEEETQVKDDDCSKGSESSQEGEEEESE